MSQNKYSRYEEAIYALNGLQSNSETIAKSRLERAQHPEIGVEFAKVLLNHLNITQDDLKSLKIIHVAGTKGKGSTCAFTESILREHGFKTGFYSSPHLIAVRERIRINGIPISREDFTEYFWEVYNQLKVNPEINQNMPHYFKFLTVMALKVFLQEKVDVAILEVGIGGQYDCTNAVQKSFVTGISSLGIDHTGLLGNTIDKIAWQKAGIFKPNIPAYTVSQPAEAMTVLQKRAEEINTPLYLVPPFESYEYLKLNGISLQGPAQKLNSSLAIQLAKYWLDNHKNNINNAKIEVSNNNTLPEIVPSFKLSSTFIKGLSNCKWPGRCQIVKANDITYFLDGAHTSESMENCVAWFKEARKQNDIKDKVPLRVLIFNKTGDRDPLPMLSQLVSLGFNCAIFVPNRVNREQDSSSDTLSLNCSLEKEISIYKSNLENWSHFVEKDGLDCKSMCFPCLNDAVLYLQSLPNSNNSVEVLVTGSLLLVGNFLSLVQPDLI